MTTAASLLDDAETAPAVGSPLDRQVRPHWWLTKDGDLDCLEMYLRHYSAYHYADHPTHTTLCLRQLPYAHHPTPTTLRPCLRLRPRLPLHTYHPTPTLTSV